MEVSIGCVSDTHGFHRRMNHKIPACDILLHSGDYTNRGEKHQVEDFLKWLTEQNQCTYKVFIGGNHDVHGDPKFNGETNADTWFQELLDKYDVNNPEGNLFYLNNNSVNLLGLNIWGSPITPWFYGDHWAHNAHRGTEIKNIWEQIPLDSDIVITHGPVIYKGDYVGYNQNQHVGCADLDYRLREVLPILHVCGHIHSGYGIEETVDTIYCNASICDESYKPINEPHLITLNI